MGPYSAEAYDVGCRGDTYSPDAPCYGTLLAQQAWVTQVKTCTRNTSASQEGQFLWVGDQWLSVGSNPKTFGNSRQAWVPLTFDDSVSPPRIQKQVRDVGNEQEEKEGETRGMGKVSPLSFFSDAPRAREKKTRKKKMLTTILTFFFPFLSFLSSDRRRRPGPRYRRRHPRQGRLPRHRVRRRPQPPRLRPESDPSDLLRRRPRGRRRVPHQVLLPRRQARGRGPRVRLEEAPRAAGARGVRGRSAQGLGIDRSIDK